MQCAFAELELKEVAVIGAFFTRWLSHGHCVENLHKGLAGILDGYESICDQKTDGIGLCKGSWIAT